MSERLLGRADASRGPSLGQRRPRRFVGSPNIGPARLVLAETFGQALARIVSAMGLNTVVLASGGMSHYPGLNAMRHPTLPGTARRSPGLPPATSNRWPVMTQPHSTPPAMSNSAAGLAPRARLVSASPISS